jgi:transmembrane sensor
MATHTVKPTREMIAEASAWLIEFRTGDPSQGERDRFKAWLCTSPQHIQAYFEVAAAWSELPSEDPDGRIDIQQMLAATRATSDTNIVLFPHARTSVPARFEPARAKIRNSPFSLGAIAASLVLMLAAAAAGVYLHSQRGTYQTATGEQRSLTLADGSTVELNAQTTVRIRYTDSERHINLLRGQALFRVAKDQTRPFIVRTGDTHVRAVGTQFDVYRKTTATIITVVEGTVAVTGDGIQPKSPPAQGLRPQASGLSLAAGEQLAIEHGIAAKLENADLEAATAWTQKRLVFEDTPLSEVADEFNRYSIRRLVVVDAELQQLGVSGLYSSTDPTALVAFLKTQPGIAVSETATEILITRK